MLCSAILKCVCWIILFSFFVYRQSSCRLIKVHLVLHWSLQIHCLVVNRWPSFAESLPPLWFCTLWLTHVCSMAGKWSLKKDQCLTRLSNINISIRFRKTFTEHWTFKQNIFFFFVNQYFRWCWSLSWSVGVTAVWWQRSCKDVTFSGIGFRNNAYKAM